LGSSAILDDRSPGCLTIFGLRIIAGLASSEQGAFRVLLIEMYDFPFRETNAHSNGSQ
jgi:hypothetical protein